MRILLINQFFWPDSSATSQLLTDLARGLADEGHEVMAHCAAPGYAIADQGDAPHVHITRIPALPFGRGRFGRVLSYLSFYAGATLRTLTGPRPDLVLTLTTPPLISLLGTLAKKLRGSRHFIWEMDMYPDVAVDLHYLHANSLLTRLTGAVADLTRRNADGIIALGECMKDRLIGRGVPSSRIFVAHNWADGRSIKPASRPPGDRNRLILLYSGNLGLAHDLETIQAAMLALKEDPRFLYRFVGSGGRRQELRAFAETHSLTALEFQPYVQRAGLSETLSAGDIGLVTQHDACCGSVVPSKVYGLLAAGRPVLFIGPRDATPARIIRRFACGWHIPCGDGSALTRLLRRLADDRPEIHAAGHRARQAFLDHFDLPLGVARIVRILDASTPDTDTAHSANDTDNDAREAA